MARGNITQTTKDLVVDNGAVLITTAAGEQLKFDVTLGWIPNLTGCVISAKLVEAQGETPGSTPTEVKPGGYSITLTKGSGYISGVDDGDSTFSITLPYNLASSLSTPPTPTTSAYMFIDVEVGESGTGDPETGVTSAVSPAKQVWKPLRGLVEIIYSTTGV